MPEPKVVYQYDLTGKFIKSYDSQKDAERATKVSQSCISGACRGKYNYAGQFFWSFNYYPNGLMKKPTRDRKLKMKNRFKKCKIKKDGVTLKFDCIQDVAIYLNCHRSSVSAVLAGRMAKIYGWTVSEIK